MLFEQTIQAESVVQGLVEYEDIIVRDVRLSDIGQSQRKTLLFNIVAGRLTADKNFIAQKFLQFIGELPETKKRVPIFKEFLKRQGATDQEANEVVEYIVQNYRPKY